MSRVGRNQPCHCASGRKTKRCCGTQRGPSESDLAKTRLAHRATNAARTLAHLSDRRLLDLFDELRELPARDLSLLVPLPQCVSPELARRYRAIANDDVDRAEDLLPAVLERTDTPRARARRCERHRRAKHAPRRGSSRAARRSGITAPDRPGIEA